MVSVVPTARDLIFEFSDSCNCWSQCCCYPPPPKVYVNSKGQVEPFDPKKSTPESPQRSANHIIEAINRKATVINADIVKLQEKISPIITEITIDKQTTLSHIAKINDVMLSSLPLTKNIIPESSEKKTASPETYSKCTEPDVREGCIIV